MHKLRNWLMQQTYNRLHALISSVTLTN